MKYYNWEKVLSYNADITFVTAVRGKGKTYGIRRFFVKRFIEAGERFCEITRYKNELSSVTRGYFDKLCANEEFPGYIFKVNGMEAYIAEDPGEDGGKPDWKVCGYFVPLSIAGTAKKTTYANVRNLVMDEAIIDKQVSPHQRYLPNEYAILCNVVDSVTREHPNEPGYVKPRIFLLANACDLLNPYFAAFGIKAIPKEGFTWYKHKTVMLHYSKDPADALEKLQNTVSGRMIAGTQAANVAAYNAFPNDTEEFIAPKPKNSVYEFGIRYDGMNFGVWCDEEGGNYHIVKKIPNNSKKPVFALSTKDHGINYLMAKKSTPAIKMLLDLFYLNCVRYDSIQTRDKFLQVVGYLGVR